MTLIVGGRAHHRATDPVARILDISRGAVKGDLRTEIVEGLQADPAQLPSLLLWDDDGLRLFNRLAQSEPYYLGRKEGEILKKHVAAIAAQIPAGTVIIELGCGDLYKTRLILSALEQQRRAVSYLALDVSAQELSASLDALEQEFVGAAYVDIRGLHGTYDDCVHWIAQGAPLRKHVTFLWMGNSMTNGGFDGAQSVLRDAAAACKRSGLGAQFLVSCDACQDPVRLMAAYDAAALPLRDFILHGLDSANRVLGRIVFQPADWTVYTQYDAKHSMVDVSYTPIRELVFHVEDGRPPVSLQPGAKVRAITSGKWSPQQMDAVAHGAHLQIERTWMDDDQIYGRCNDILGGLDDAS
ncbi:histidine-specific methyltransferase [Aspergillus candidus]|uniref:Histidine-specific methyltransferase n=1 Tax=Aspergillus candidus TaxID=41067 RepID=A0A2I2FE68_ASPCN|nr:histidine-specific methyltransferase [Aspergillus candidus]PLB38914.1 histidine-specific methyltransferase [Aspergillus candidus]